MKLRTISACILSASAVLIAGCSDAVVHSTAPATNVYVLNNNDSQDSEQIFGFPATSTGSVTPSVTISLPQDQDDDFDYSQLATDSTGNVYNANTVFSPQTGSVSTISVYAPTSATSPTPVRQFTSTVMNDTVNGMAVDATGNLYISIGGATVYKFASAASGASTPAATITFGGGKVATDTNGNLYVADDNIDNQIEIYNAGFTNAATPSRIINSTVPLDIRAIAADLNGNLYVAGNTSDNNETPEVQVFSSTANGTVAPMHTISGSSTTLISPRDIKVNANGTIFVLDQSNPLPADNIVPLNSLRTPIVLQFAASSDGNVAPAGSSTSTSFSQASYLAIH